MVRVLFGLMLAAALTGSTVVTVEAQYLPPGSYQASCRHIRVNGDILSASCTAPSGQHIRSSIPVSMCRGAGIANINGRLACGQPPSGGFMQPPYGSYQASCVNVVMHRNGVLVASCTPPNGPRIRSSINVYNCQGRGIRNSNGYLAC
jgi:hypothetical protein